MIPAVLHIVTAVSNPIRWQSRIALAKEAIAGWMKDPNVQVTIVECGYGGRPYDLVEFAADVKATHIPVRAQTAAWSKENLLGIGIARLPQDAVNIGTFDADILFRKPGWGEEALHALQLYPVIQPWVNAYDLGPHDTHLQTHVSFAYCYASGKPVIAESAKYWKFAGGPYDYPHSGYAWCWTRDILNRVGGLFEVGGMGSGDHHMALGLTGNAQYSMPPGISTTYRNAVLQWQSRALLHVNKKVGYAPGTIEHMFHGSKVNRAYQDRWDMFLRHGFDPYTDLKKNSYGVIEFSGNKPELEREWMLYMRAREEDANIV